MAIASKPTAEDTEPHPITLIAILVGIGKTRSTTCLLDQCCTDNGLISYEMAKLCNLETKPAKEKANYNTATVNFTISHTVTIPSAKLPYLLNNRSTLR